MTNNGGNTTQLSDYRDELLTRNTFRLASRKYWDELKRDVKPIYTAPNADAARAALDELADKWGGRYPAITKLWANAWEEFIGVPGL